MVQGKTFLAGIAIVLIAGALSAADLLMKEWPRYTQSGEDVAIDLGTSSSSAVTSSMDSSDTTSSVSSAMMSSSSSRSVVKKGTSTKKSSGPDVAMILRDLNLTPTQTSEASFLLLTAPNETSLQNSVLLLNNDRAFLFSWVETDNAKAILRALKTALQEQFSGKLTDLVDETRTPEGGPVVDVLSFYDPALSSEKIVFLRVRNRLYEIHVAKNGEDILYRLIENLTK